VVLPDLFRGTAMKPGDDVVQWAGKHDYKDVIKPELTRVFAYLEAAGVERLGLMGFCWGSWTIFKIANDKDFKEKVLCGVNCHPSVKLEQVFKRDPLKLAEEDMKTPMLLLAAENDPRTFVVVVVVLFD
jgi:dienelactone hydrolase